ncbi:predicted protein [Thalassiosira pseudonana CCMP1335]|uniref:Uncharacterized protein n=1 Tax=Thalassiosira pseudonana TaxID=35128 RepID=B8CFS3_THAPS|nr:predicted protein [Thalassiosira pseudonana CCMP1335]EED87680.1 predicted protein [Thalassiosira pseudonana CCMP1335]
MFHRGSSLSSSCLVVRAFSLLPLYLLTNFPYSVYSLSLSAQQRTTLNNKQQAPTSPPTTSYPTGLTLAPTSLPATTIITFGEFSFFNSSSLAFGERRLTTTTKDELFVLADLFEDVLFKTISTNLSESQALTNITVTAIGGTPIVRTTSRRLETTSVAFEATIEETCATCGFNDVVATGLFDQVSSNLVYEIERGGFATSIQLLAQEKNVTSLASVSVAFTGLAGFVMLTEAPTLKPSFMPSLSVQPTVTPTSSPVRKLAKSGKKRGAKLV